MVQKGYENSKGGDGMKVETAVAEKITIKLVNSGVISEIDTELYKYGIENGIIITGNLLASFLFGLITGRLGNILVFLFFYGTLRSYSGGLHCKGRKECFLLSIIILFIPAYLGDMAINIPLMPVIICGVVAVTMILGLSPVESVNKPLDEEERKYYKRISRCIAEWQICVLVMFYCLDMLNYFYAGYSSLLLVAIFLIIGKIYYFPNSIDNKYR